MAFPLFLCCVFVCLFFFLAFLWGFSNNVADEDFTTVKLNLVDRPWYQIHKTWLSTNSHCQSYVSPDLFKDDFIKSSYSYFTSRNGLDILIPKLRTESTK